MLNAIDNLGLRMNVIAKVTRNLQLERNILQRPALIVARRHTAHPNNLYSMASTNIPFGLRGRRRQVLRGRKRNTLNIVVQAAQPNVDGRSLATAQASTSMRPLPPPQPQTPPNVVLKKNTVPKKPITYARQLPARPTVRRLTFPSSPPLSSSPSPPSSPLRPSSPTVINLPANATDATSTTNPPPDFGALDFGQI